MKQVQTPETTLMDAKQPQRILAGTPETIYDWLTQITEVYGTDEIMMQTVTGNHKGRLKSQYLLAKEFYKRQAVAQTMAS